jgi:cytochrome b561
MKTLPLVMVGISTILLLSTLVCGLWLRFAGEAVTNRAESVQFHMILGIATTIIVLVTLGIVLVRK